MPNAVTYNPDYDYIIGNANKGPFSMTFNGIKLDDAQVLPNLVIYDVEGRDSLSSEISELSYGRVDGSRFRYRRNEAKDLVVHYTIVTNTDSDQRNALNKLRGILYAPGSENAKIIFSDESDKYYVGTVSNITQEKILYNNTSDGEITIRLSKPYKYATNATTVTPQAGTNRFVIDYDGTRKAYPEITITFPTENVEAGGTITNAGDCGFVAFVNQNGNVIQLGDPDETNLDSKSTNTTLVNQKFTLWDSTASANWSANSNKAFFGTDITKTGSFSRQERFVKSYLGSVSMGTGDKWHGPSITYTIPDNNISDFTVSFGVVAATGGNPSSARDMINEVGRLKLQVANDSHVLTEFEVIKSSKASLDASMNLYCGGDTEPWWSKNFAAKTFNKTFGFRNTSDVSDQEEPLRTVSIEKKSETYTISLGDEVHSFTVNNGDLGNAKYLTLWVGNYSTGYPMGCLGFTDVRFQSNHWATNEEMRNSFTTNDVCRINCETGEIFLNNASKPSLGAIGNQWEQFALLPGVNYIDISWSSWVEVANKPTFSMTYRKAYV